MASETLQLLDVEVRIRYHVTGSDGAQLGPREIYKYVRFSDGTGNNQAGQVFVDESWNINATNTDLDLVGSTQTDFKGAALDMNSLKLLYVENLDTETGDYAEVIMPASNGVTGLFKAAGDGMKVHPAGFLLWCAPGPDSGTVTGNTGDLINLLTADNSNLKVLAAGDNT